MSEDSSSLVSSGRIQVTQEKYESAWTEARGETEKRRISALIPTEISREEVWKKWMIRYILAFD